MAPSCARRRPARCSRPMAARCTCATPRARAASNGGRTRRRAPRCSFSSRSSTATRLTCSRCGSPAARAWSATTCCTTAARSPTRPRAGRLVYRARYSDRIGAGMKTIPLKYIKEDPGVGNADDSTDAQRIDRHARAPGRRPARPARGALPRRGKPLRRADLLLQLGRALVRLEKRPEAWAAAREAFDLYLAEQAWEGAAQACDILFLADAAAVARRARPGHLARGDLPGRSRAERRAAAARGRRDAARRRRRGGRGGHGVLPRRSARARAAARAPAPLRQPGARHGGAPAQRRRRASRPSTSGSRTWS